MRGMMLLSSRKGGESALQVANTLIFVGARSACGSTRKIKPALPTSRAPARPHVATRMNGVSSRAGAPRDRRVVGWVACGDCWLVRRASALSVGSAAIGFRFGSGVVLHLVRDDSALRQLLQARAAASLVTLRLRVFVATWRPTQPQPPCGHGPAASACRLALLIRRGWPPLARRHADRSRLAPASPVHQ